MMRVGKGPLILGIVLLASLGTNTYFLVSAESTTRPELLDVAKTLSEMQGGILDSSRKLYQKLRDAGIEDEQAVLAVAATVDAALPASAEQAYWRSRMVVSRIAETQRIERAESVRTITAEATGRTGSEVRWNGLQVEGPSAAAFLPAEKRLKIQALQSSSNGRFVKAIEGGATSIYLSELEQSERAQLASDIRSLLTDGEFSEYQMRNSVTGARLADEFDFTESQYREAMQTIYPEVLSRPENYNSTRRGLNTVDLEHLRKIIGDKAVDRHDQVFGSAGLAVQKAARLQQLPPGTTEAALQIVRKSRLASANAEKQKSVSPAAELRLRKVIGQQGLEEYRSVAADAE